MKITMLTLGTQGAVEPLVCLGAGLMQAGHEVTVATHENFRTFVTRRGIGFAATAGDAKKMLKASTVDRQFRSGGNPLTYFLALRLEARDLSKHAAEVLDRCVEVCRGADALLYHHHMYPADSIAEYYGVPGIQAYNTAITPTSGFGSMKYGDQARLTDQAIRAVRMTRQRAVPLTGWGAVVHAGGAGTLTAGLRAGLPTLTVPFGGDSIFWSWRCTQLGAGPQPIPVYRLNTENLAAGIKAITGDPRFRNRAEEVGRKIRAEDGVATAIKVFHDSLGVTQPSTRA
jgi:UDP:flavonoid glycosyltransferase YjiC (YdhE family)